MICTLISAVVADHKCKSCVFFTLSRQPFFLHSIGACSVVISYRIACVGFDTMRPLHNDNSGHLETSISNSLQFKFGEVDNIERFQG